jgi:ArsR family transcriptional regulator, arsenate/arsenite/antimonite-responsive transcriptional repressor
MSDINKENKIAEIFKALGHPARLKILQLLHVHQFTKIPVRKIHESLGLAQSETSRHLIVLKNASVLICEKEGNNSIYSVNYQNTLVESITLCINSNVESIK